MKTAVLTEVIRRRARPHAPDVVDLTAIESTDDERPANSTTEPPRKRPRTDTRPSGNPVPPRSQAHPSQVDVNRQTDCWLRHVLPYIQKYVASLSDDFDKPSLSTEVKHALIRNNDFIAFCNDNEWDFQDAHHTKIREFVAREVVNVAQNSRFRRNPDRAAPSISNSTPNGPQNGAESRKHLNRHPALSPPLPLARKTSAERLTKYRRSSTSQHVSTQNGIVSRPGTPQNRPTPRTVTPVPLPPYVNSLARNTPNQTPKRTVASPLPHNFVTATKTPVPLPQVTQVVDREKSVLGEQSQASVNAGRQGVLPIPQPHNVSLRTTKPKATGKGRMAVANSRASILKAGKARPKPFIRPAAVRQTRGRVISTKLARDLRAAQPVETRPRFPRSQQTYTSAGSLTGWTFPDHIVPAVPLSLHSSIHSGHRPYIPANVRHALSQDVKLLSSVPRGALRQPMTYHVDFTIAEWSQVIAVAQKYSGNLRFSEMEVLKLLMQRFDFIEAVQKALIGRSITDIQAFLQDFVGDQASPPAVARKLVIARENEHQRVGRRINRLRFERELFGNSGIGRVPWPRNFHSEFRKLNEDTLEVVSEFTNCAGDLWAMSWISNRALICGTTNHTDRSSQQYNKKGNLLLCSLTSGKVQAYPDHRIPRPIISTGENSSAAMRHAMEDWLYCSVTCADFDKTHEVGYTSSYDKTVKVWQFDSQQERMTSIATWSHDGHVNFVYAARDGSRRVATGADVPTDSVRVYTLNPEAPGRSSYQSFSCSRTDAESSDKWCYCPAAMRWGIAPGTQHLLLVGFSPRSLTDDESDIPEDKKHTGEIALWDSIQGCKLPITTGSTANVFEVAWHPQLPQFYAATAPSGLVKRSTRTQVHVLQKDPDRANTDGAYIDHQKLDCPALDINELAIMPNHAKHAYVAAGCTNKTVYVWDTAQGDVPIHRLQHGKPLEEYRDEDQEAAADVGMKFTAWGSTPDRFYTGGTDGKVNVWNIRNKRKAFVRTIFEASSAISFGAFSPDKKTLAIGDASGRLFLLSLEPGNSPDAPALRRRPQEIQLHADPAPPVLDAATEELLREMTQGEDLGDEEDHEQWVRRKFIASGALVQHAKPFIGWVQGPNYPRSGLFRAEAHLDHDPTKPLMPAFERQQLEAKHASMTRRRSFCRRLKTLKVQDGLLCGPAKRNQRATGLELSEFTDFELMELMAGSGSSTYSGRQRVQQTSREELEDLVRGGKLLTIEDTLEASDRVEDTTFCVADDTA